jgi:tRNA(Ile)-lysidine synthase
MIACSGGADSTALAESFHDFVERNPALQLRLSIGHVDHGLRQESVSEVELVRSLADELSTPFLLETLDTAALREAMRKSGLEAAARDFRYAALERLAARAGCDRIATGHTQTDQAETVLLRLARGGGLGALAGIRSSRALGRTTLIRPLLNVSREATEALCARTNHAFTQDPHNLDPRRARAKLRSSFARFKEVLGPHLAEHLAACAAVAAEEDALLDSMARAALGDAISRGGSIPLAPLVALPAVLLRRAILIAANAAAARPERLHLENLSRLICRGYGTLDLPGGRALVGQGTLRFQSGKAGREPLQPLKIEGAGTFRSGEIALQIGPPAGENVCVDLRLAPFPWTLRAAVPGDKFRPAKGRIKLVRELWIDAKIPREQRPGLPLLEDANGALFYVSGLRPSEACLRWEQVSDFPACVSLRFSVEEGASLPQETEALS